MVVAVAVMHWLFSVVSAVLEPVLLRCLWLDQATGGGGVVVVIGGFIGG